MLNTVLLMGRPTVSPELKTTASGKSVTSFCLAVDRDSKDAKTDFIDIVAYEKNAEFASKYIQKGRMIAVKGQLRTNEWTDKDGKNRKTYQVTVDRFYFADSKPKDEPQDEPQNTVFTPVEDDDGDLPF